MMFALGNKMQNVMAMWIVRMEVMKKAAVSRNTFLLIFCISPSVDLFFHFHFILGIIPLEEVATGQARIVDIGELNPKWFLRIKNSRVNSFNSFLILKNKK